MKVFHNTSVRPELGFAICRAIDKMATTTTTTTTHSVSVSVRTPLESVLAAQLSLLNLVASA